MEENLLPKDPNQEKQEDQEHMKKRVKKEEKQPPELSLLRPWCDLPSDILRKISSKLFLVGRLSFSFTCKYWQAIPIPPSQKVEPPWLAILSKSEGLINLLDTTCNRTYKVSSRSAIGASIQSSNFGWLLLSKCNGDNVFKFFFFNPLTREEISLPPFKMPLGFDTACFSAPPTSPNCIACVLKYGQRRDSWSYLIVFLRNPENNRKEWVLWEWVRVTNLLVPPHRPIFCDGRLYCAREEGGVVVHEIEPHDLNYIFNPTPRNSNDSMNYVAEFNGDAFLICIPGPDMHVQIQKVDAARRTMEEVTTIGNKAVFVSPQGAMMVDAPMDGMENKIHYPLFGPQGDQCQGFGHYSLETHEYYPNPEFNMATELVKFRAKESEFTWAWLEPRLKE